MKPYKRRVLIIYTGGTIGMIKNPVNGALDTFNLEHLIKHVPELSEFEYDIKSCQYDKPIDSSDIQPFHWSMIVDIISNYYNIVDGFVILHGTDTMAYTASALSFMLQNINKPVILTGSQLPIGILRTDGKENIINAVEFAAAADANGISVLREVAVCFGQYLYRGNRVTKCNVDNFNAFTAYNENPLAVAGVDINYDYKNLYRPNEGSEFIPHHEMNSQVIAITLFPGISPQIVRHVLEDDDIKGGVLRTFGSGNAPKQQWLINALKTANEKGKIIVNITQCQRCAVEMERYQTGYQLYQAGVVNGRDMTVECAVTKLMFLLSKNLRPMQIRSLMAQSLVGELTI